MKQVKDKLNFNVRYGDDWTVISRLVKAKCKGLCCFPGCDRPAEETHHALYSINGKLIAGTKFERKGAGSILFPLCGYHHSSKHRQGAHHPSNWKWDKNSPVDGNKNTPEYYLKLRQGWLEKTEKQRLIT